MSDVVDLGEIKIAMAVCKELPLLRNILLDVKDKLEPYLHYTDAKNVYSEIESSLIMIDLHHASYKSVLEKK